MSLEQIARRAIEKQFDKLIDTVYADFVGAVSEHSKTGEAAGSISIMERSSTHALIGGKNDHLYWLDEGNNHSGARIVAKGRALGKYPDGIPGIGWRKSVSAHEGYHIARKVADKYR